MSLEENKKLKIAIQGYPGSFHHLAVEKYYHKSVSLVPKDSFNDLFAAMKTDKSIDQAVMAIENSIAGSILPNYQLLRKSLLFVVGEIYLQIRQNLLVLPNTEIGDLEEVYSHPMAILQCEDFFSAYPEIKLIEAEDTALSAKKVKEIGDKTQGAIASLFAAELYGLQVLEESIETVKNNFTRFLILSEEKPETIAGVDKASIHFQLQNTPGALLKALQVIEEHDINISKIQSIPEVDREWRYYFHLDLEFNDLNKFNRTIDALEKVTHELRVFGIYKKGKTVRE